MLGKLLKDELKSYIFPSAIALAIGTGFTVFFRILTMLPYRNESARGQMVILFGYAMYYLLMLMITSANIFAIVRFYKTTISDCGYLTWTLPVKTSTIIWSKLIGAMILKLVFVIAAIFDMFLYTVGNLKGVFRIAEMHGEVNDASFLSRLMEIVNIRVVILLALFVIFCVVLNVYEQVTIYFCMAVGQLVGRMRILASIGCYVVISIINQIFVFFMMMFAIFSENTFIFNIYSEPGIFENYNGLDVFNGCLFVCIIITGIAAVLYFALTNFIFKNRLNLE